MKHTLIILTLILLACSTSDKQMDAIVSIQPNGIMIYSKISYDRVRLKLNDDFSASVDRINGSEENLILYSSFTNSKNEMFDPKIYKVKKLYVSGFIGKQKYWSLFNK